MPSKAEKYPEIEFTRPVPPALGNQPIVPYDLKVSHKEVSSIFAEITKPRNPGSEWQVKLPRGSKPEEIGRETLDQAVEAAVESIKAHRQLLSDLDEYALVPDPPRPVRRQSDPG